MKKSLLRFAALIVVLVTIGAGKTFANELNLANVVKMQQNAALNRMEASDVATFLEIVEPRFRGNHEALAKAVAVMDENPDGADNAIAALLEYLINSGMTMQKALTLITEYRTKVLPIYTWLMSNRVTPAYEADGVYKADEVYHTPVDGAYYGIGDPRNSYNPYGLSEAEQEEALADGAKLKRSGSYVWGMTTYGGKLYWSTNTNYMCVPGYAAVASSGGDTTEGLDNGCWVCEYKYSARANEVVDTPNGPVKLGTSGDIMVPRVFCLDPSTNVVEDITPKEGTEAYKVLCNCQGLRSASTFDDLIFFGGPGLASGSSTSATSSAFVCYDPIAGEYIGSSDMSNIDGCRITNVRRWVDINGILYCSVGLIDTKGSNRGAVLRWYGDRNDPFNFHIVGWTDCEAAEIEYYNDRIWVGGWPVTAVYDPATGAQYPYAEIYRGPVVPEGGLTPEDAYLWERVWRYQDYQNQSCYTSSMRAFNGKLYWGMFGSAFGGFYAANRIYGDNFACPDALAKMFAELQSTTFWRLDDMTGSDKPVVELLYGEENIWKNYGGFGPNVAIPVGPAQKADPIWRLQPNGMGLKPLFGRSGYGNLFTSYTWALTMYHDKLMIGTMEMSDLIPAAIGGATPDKAAALNLIKVLLGVNESEMGFECLAMENPDVAPKYVTSNAFGNPMSYGIRNFTVVGDDLYIGSANPFNIHDNGGWQIFRVNDGIDTAVEQVAAPEKSLMTQAKDGYTVFYTTDGAQIDDISVVDAAGRIIDQTSVKSNVAYVWTNAMAAGTYVAKVKAGKDEWTSKFIVK